MQRIQGRGPKTPQETQTFKGWKRKESQRRIYIFLKSRRTKKGLYKQKLNGERSFTKDQVTPGVTGS